MNTKITIMEGNLLDAWEEGSVQFAGHGANCFGVMGSGIAGQIARRMPPVYDLDRAALASGQVVLGGCSALEMSDGRLFFNLYTQYRPGPDATIEAIISALKAARFNIVARGDNIDAPIAIPQLGCGIGGLTWSKVESALLSADGIGDLIVYVYKPR